MFIWIVTTGKVPTPALHSVPAATTSEAGGDATSTVSNDVTGEKGKQTITSPINQLSAIEPPDQEDPSETWIQACHMI